MQKEIKIGNKTVLVDANLYDFLTIYSWFISSGGGGKDKKEYAATSMRVGRSRKMILMHRLITGMTSKNVDHINGNGLDNRRKNLRLCEHSQNMSNMRTRKNKFGFKGVKGKNGMYASQIGHKGKRYGKSGFKTAEEAARHYDKMSLELHGEFGVRNFHCETLAEIAELKNGL